MPPSLNRKQAVDQLTDQALARQRAGQLDEALALYAQALALAPRDANALHLSGLVHLRKGNKDEAVRLIRKAIEANPTIAAFYNSLGNAYLAGDNPEQAVTAFRRALSLDARLLGAYVNLAIALRKQEKLDEAIASCRAALALDERFGAAHFSLGNLLRDQEKFAEAAVSFRRAVELMPQSAEAHINLGMSHRMLKQWPEAVAALHKALALGVLRAEALTALGRIYHDMGRYDEAVACYDESLALRPDRETTFRRSFSFLLRGRFAEGWPGYVDGRPKDGHHRRPLGGNLNGQHVFLEKDQGLGDEIFFLRFAPELKRRGAEISYLTGGKIKSIVSRLAFLDEVIADGVPARPSDMIVSVGDLPFLFGMTSVADIPPPLPLPVLPDRVPAQQAALAAAGPPPYIGVTWRAGNAEGNFFKLAPLDRVGATMQGLNATFIALQRLPEAGEIAALSRAIGRPVHDFTALNDSLEDMLALLSLLDDYVTVSNTNVHLRAGTGRVSRVMVPTPPEWRWFAAGGESPWFPGTPVYRQDSDGSWDEALAALRADLVTRWSVPGATC